MNKYVIVVVSLLLFSACRENISVNVPELSDGDPTTCYTGAQGLNKIVFDTQCSIPIQSYKLYSSGETPEHDPATWTLKGSYDGTKWVVIDERKDQRFCSRYQEILCTIANPSNYKQYMLEASTEGNDILIIGDVSFSEKNLLTDWKDFRYPEVDFEVLDPQTKGASIYADLVQDPDAYIKYHAEKVAEILFYTAQDTMNDVQTIQYTLKDYDGVSAKSGNPPVISIEYSTHREVSQRVVV